MIEFDVENEKIFVQALREGDDDAWETIYLKTVMPVLRSSTSGGVSYYRIMQDRNLDAMTLHSMLCEDMLCKKRLDNYQFRCPVIYWMRRYVMKLILEYCKKNDNPVSDENLPELSISESRREEWDLVEECFNELWRSNPMRAYIYLLRRYDDLPSKTIAQLLSIQSGNVDQYFSRANSDMLELLAQHGGRL